MDSFMQDKRRILTINSESGWRRKPIRLLNILGQILVSELEKLVKEATSEDVLDSNLSRPQGIEKEEEFSDRRARVEIVKRLLQTVQLGQGVDQFGDVVF